MDTATASLQVTSPNPAGTRSAVRRPQMSSANIALGAALLVLPLLFVTALVLRLTGRCGNSPALRVAMVTALRLSAVALAVADDAGCTKDADDIVFVLIAFALAFLPASVFVSRRHPVPIVIGFVWVLVFGAAAGMHAWILTDDMLCVAEML